MATANPPPDPSGPRQLIRKAASCSICSEPYADPRMLECGHTFCLQCMEDQVKDDRIVCPKCRKITTTINQDVKELPRNVQLTELLQLVENTEYPEIDLEEMRKVCDEDNTEHASFHCMVCDENMCTTCTDKHRVGFKKHELLQVSIPADLKALYATSKTHTTDLEAQIYYCDVCKEPIFQTSAMLSAHKTHDKSNIVDRENVQTNLKKDFQMNQRDLEVLMHSDAELTSMTDMITQKADIRREEINRWENENKNVVQKEKGKITATLETEHLINAMIENVLDIFNNALEEDTSDMITQKADSRRDEINRWENENKNVVQKEKSRRTATLETKHLINAMIENTLNIFNNASEDDTTDDSHVSLGSRLTALLHTPPYEKLKTTPDIIVEEPADITTSLVPVKVKTGPLRNTKPEIVVQEPHEAVVQFGSVQVSIQVKEIPLTETKQETIGQDPETKPQTIDQDQQSIAESLDEVVVVPSTETLITKTESCLYKTRLLWKCDRTNKGQIKGANGVSFTADGDIIVPDTKKNRLQVFGRQQGELMHTIGNGQLKPYDVAVKGDLIYATDRWNRCVQVYNASTGVHRQSWGLHQYVCPYGITCLRNGNIAVINYGRIGYILASGVRIHDGTTGDIITSFGQRNTSHNMKRPIYIAENSKGQIIISDYDGDCIQICDNNGNVLQVIREAMEGKQVFQPTGVCVDPYYNILLSTNCSSWTAALFPEYSIIQFDPSGRCIGTVLKQEGWSRPQGLALHPDGKSLAMIERFFSVFGSHEELKLFNVI